MKTRYEWLLVLLIFALAFTLRVHDLGKESIWLDEGFALEAINRNAIGVVQWTATFDPIPPFYYIVLHYWSGIFGTSEIAIRSLSVLFSMAALSTIFLLAKKIFNMKVAIITAALFATEMLQVQYAQEARAFTLFMLLAWLSTLLFVYSIQERKYLIPYVIVSALALYTLQLMVAVILIHNTLFFLGGKKETKKWLIAQAAILMLFLPWIGIFAKQFMLIHQLFQTGLLQRLGLPYLIGVLGVFWMLIAFLLFYSAIIYVYAKKNNELQKAIDNQYLFVIGVIVVILTYLLLLPRLTSSFIPARYALFGLPALYIYFAYMIERMKSRKIAASLFALVIVLNCFALYTYYSHSTKPEWRESVTYLNEHAQEGDVIVLDTGFSEMLYRYYGGELEAYGLMERPFSLSRHREYIEQIKPELKQKRGVWLVFYRNFVTKDLYKESLEKNFTLVSEKEFKEIKVYQYAN